MSRRHPPLPPAPGPATRIAAYTRWLVEQGLLNPDVVEMLVGSVGVDRRRVPKAEIAAQLYRLWERTAAPVTTPVDVVAELDELLKAAPNGSARARVVYHLLAWLRTGSLTPTR